MAVIIISVSIYTKVTWRQFGLQSNELPTALGNPTFVVVVGGEIISRYHGHQFLFFIAEINSQL